MTKTLYVTGKMYEANTVNITDAELVSLLTAEQGDGEFWENLEELHDRLMGDSVMNGFPSTSSTLVVTLLVTVSGLSCLLSCRLSLRSSGSV